MSLDFVFIERIHPDINKIILDLTGFCLLSAQIDMWTDPYGIISP